MQLNRSLSGGTWFVRGSHSDKCGKPRTELSTGTIKSNTHRLQRSVSPGTGGGGGGVRERKCNLGGSAAPSHGLRKVLAIGLFLTMSTLQPI